MQLWRAVLSAAAIPILAVGLVGGASAGRCLDRVAGQGTGMGVGGVGTQVAKKAALADWEANVRGRFGAAFAARARAQSVRYDCRSAFALEAKCVISAKPCR